MIKHRTLATALIGGAAALALGLGAAPANAASVSSTSFSVTLTGSNSASVTACYTLNPSSLDVNESITYTEKVEVWGDDQHDTIHSKDDFMASAYSASRTFTNTSSISVCRTKSFSDRDDLNEDTGLGQDELYAKIKLVPNDPQLRTVTKKTSIVSLRV